MPPQTKPNTLDFEAQGTFLGTVRLLTPYIWPADRADLKLRVALAIVLMIAAKFVTIAVPYAFKFATDALAPQPDAATASLPAALAGVFALTALYGALAHSDGVDASRGATRCSPPWRCMRCGGSPTTSSCICTGCRCAITWSARPAA